MSHSTPNRDHPSLKNFSFVLSNKNQIYCHLSLKSQVEKNFLSQKISFSKNRFFWSYWFWKTLNIFVSLFSFSLYEFCFIFKFNRRLVNLKKKGIPGRFICFCHIFRHLRIYLFPQNYEFKFWLIEKTFPITSKINQNSLYKSIKIFFWIKIFVC